MTQYVSFLCFYLNQLFIWHLALILGKGSSSVVIAPDMHAEGPILIRVEKWEGLLREILESYCPLV